MINLNIKFNSFCHRKKNEGENTLDKYEYKVRSEEITALIETENYAQAAEIADSIDWRKVKSVRMLCMISDLYKINKRYEDARDLLLLAYERRPGSRSICYSLCELSIKTGELVQATEYYKEFVQVTTPDDAGRYILRYKLYKDQEVSLDERIEVLEELKKANYQEKWAYELAYLYHCVGLATRCVEECDEMIVWFGEGEYVTKAMELKMLHQPLSMEQQEKYNHRNDVKPEETWRESSVSEEENEGSEVLVGEENRDDIGDFVGGDTQIFAPVRTGEEMAETAPAKQPEELDIQVKTMDVGEYNTINLQAELAQGLQELLSAEQRVESVSEDELMREDELPADALEGAETPMEPEFVELASVEAEMVEEPARESETLKASEVFFGETGEIVMEQMRKEADQENTALQNPMEAEPPKEMANVLSQESDGQISLVIPEHPKVEKQITGQMNIEEVLAEWERMKKENEEKRKEEVRKHVLRQTGKMFTEFEASLRDGLLEQLEKSVNGPADVLTDEVEELEEIVQEDATEADVDETETGTKVVQPEAAKEKLIEDGVQAASLETAGAETADVEAELEAGGMEPVSGAVESEAEGKESEAESEIEDAESAEGKAVQTDAAKTEAAESKGRGITVRPMTREE